MENPRYTVELKVLDENGAPAFAFSTSCFREDVMVPGMGTCGLKPIADFISSVVSGI